MLAGLQVLVERQDYKDLFTAHECAMAAPFVARDADDAPAAPGDATVAGGIPEGVTDESDGAVLIADSTAGAETELVAVDGENSVRGQPAARHGLGLVLHAQEGGSASLAEAQSEAGAEGQEGSLSREARGLYVRMFQRKGPWFRVESLLKYSELLDHWRDKLPEEVPPPKP